MGAHATVQYNLDEKYEFTSEAKKRVLTWLAIGVVMFVVGLAWLIMDSGHAADAHGAGHAAAGGHGEAAAHTPGWQARLYAVLWQNSLFFTGISLIGVFFLSIQYVAWAGWSVTIKRIPEAFGAFLPYTFVVMLITFLLGGHDIFHWTHHDLFDPNSPHYDKVLAGKSGFLNTPFFLVRMVLFFGLWYMVWRILRANSLKEDLEGGMTYYNKSINISAVFLLIFGVSTSMVAWDWTMSINPHWYSTLFGWYHFASWWVSGLATIALTVILLKEKGFLPYVNSSHIHDLGKFMFAFSIFWTYLWVSQFLLIYYANIPEEIIYFKERMYSDQYRLLFFFNLLINFLFPFLFLMTRDAKRHMVLVKIAAIGILIGHWLDFYLMIMPGVTKGNSGFGFLEFGTLTIFASAFVYVVSTQIAKAGLLAKNHPMLQESLHHDI